MKSNKLENRQRKPHWLKISLPSGDEYARVNGIVKEHGLHTICSSGMCPNIGECWGNGTATFMILGDICTRGCKFCATTTGKPMPPSSLEPQQLARSIQLMNLKYCVITSVTRDDLPDEGATHWYNCIREVKQQNPDVKVEVLIPDFNGRKDLIDIVLKANPFMIAHNLETVERLTPMVRSKAQYSRSLEVLEHIAKSGQTAKSGIMVGLGEQESEVRKALADLASVGCAAVTIGQYLQPRKENYPVNEYVTPEQFDVYKQMAIELGFEFVESGPLVRSSYHAEEMSANGRRACS